MENRKEDLNDALYQLYGALGILELVDTIDVAETDPISNKLRTVVFAARAARYQLSGVLDQLIDLV